MLKETRLKRIMEMLEKEGEVKTISLCKQLGVTEMTIRRDLDFLADNNKISRIHGGAIMVGALVNSHTIAYVNEITEDAKYKIGRRALQFVEDGRRIFVDSGSTTRIMCKQLLTTARNTIATNNLTIGIELANRPYLDIIMVGGELRKETFSCYGTLTEEQIRQYRVDIAFLGASSIGEDGFFYDGVTSEAGVKKAIIQSAAKTYILIDSSKFNKYSLIAYSHVKEVDGVITDSGIDKKTLASLLLMGANIIIAE